MDETIIDGTMPAVREYLGSAFGQVQRFAEMLADQGVVRGLIGPREVPRLWDRHLLNSAAVAPYLPETGTVVDIGTGAGLPGVVLACLRPDLHTVLLEPMERRVAWLREVVTELRLDSAEVLRGRAEDVRLPVPARAVTARAVAPLGRLAGWSLPLLGAGGALLAMKGGRAAEEVEAARREIAALGGGGIEVLSAMSLPGVTPTVVVRVLKERQPATPAGPDRASRRKGRPGRVTN